MSSKSFVKILRKVIREEVRAAVKEILTEQKVNHKKVINHGMDLHAMSEGTNKPKRKFTKNSMLNDLLNETATSPLTREQTDWGSMNFRSEMAQSMGMESQQPKPLATTDVNGAPINMSNQNVAKTVDIMTKDYSGMMKAMNKLDKSKGKKVV
jgi:hypothetical protein